MQKTYTLTLTIITIACILIGTIYHVGGFFRNAFLFPLPFVGREDGNGGQQISTDESFKDVASLSIDLDVMNITIGAHSGDDVLVAYEGNERFKPQTELQGGTLTITQKQKIKLGMNDAKSNLTVSLPKETGLNGLDIILDMGNIDFSDITAEDLDIDVDMGNVEGESFSANSTDIDTDTGNVLLKSARFSELFAAADVGNIEVYSDNDLSDCKFSCTTDVGNIVINGDKMSKNYERSGNNGTVSLESDIGNILVRY